MKNKINEYRSFRKDKLLVNIYYETNEVGIVAAFFVANELNSAINLKGSANLILPAGASQVLFLTHLQQQKIDWDKITVFHLDEYKGMPETHPASFRKYLKEKILDEVRPGKVYCIKGDAPDVESELSRYENLLRKHPIDVACIGIGENGHIAFNDPPKADFNDPKLVKVVELDEICRKHQLGEGWFSSLQDVTKEALTLTIPAIMSSKTISCVVPDERKAQAVFNTLNLEITTACPATILRMHSHAILHLDLLSSGLLPQVNNN